MAIFKPHNHHPRSLARIPLFSSGLVTVQPSSLFDSLSKTNATKHSQICDLRSSLLQSDLSDRLARKSVQCFYRLFLLIREMTW